MSETEDTDGFKPDFSRIDDTDDLNQKMMIRSVNNAREKVREVRNTAREQYASAQGAGERSRAASRGAQVYLDVVKSYALEFAPLVAMDGLEMWDRTVLMEGEIEPDFAPKHGEVVDVTPDKREFKIVGLRDLMKTDLPVTAEFEVTTRQKGARDETEVKTVEWSPNVSQVDLVLIQLDKARSDLGLHFESPDSVRDRSEEGV